VWITNGLCIGLSCLFDDDDMRDGNLGRDSLAVKMKTEEDMIV
jgi:hypothetical protein